MRSSTLTQLAAFLALASGALCAAPSSAQDFPTKPVKIIVPGGAGVPTDIMLRFYADKLAERLGWTMVVENRPGGNFVPAVLAVTQAPPDGHVILDGVQSLAITPFTVKDLPYHVKKDLLPLIRFASNPNLLTVHPSVPAKNLAELIAFSKANPGKINYGTTGVGTNSHLQGELLRMLTGLDMVAVAYKDANTITPDLVSGRITVGISAIGAFVPFVKEGKMRSIAVLGPQRNPLVAEVPTASEATGLDLDIASWHGFMVHTATPRPIAERLERELTAVTNLAETRATLLKLGIDPLPAVERSEDFRKKIDAELTRWERVVRELNLPK